MRELKELFVSYEIALKLKEKGFNEACLSYLNSSTGFTLVIGTVFQDYNNLQTYPADVSAPLYQQIIDWLREKYMLEITVTADSNGMEIFGFDWKIRKLINSLDKTPIQDSNDSYNDYHQCMAVAIEKALELI